MKTRLILAFLASLLFATSGFAESAAEGSQPADTAQTASASDSSDCSGS